MIIQLQYSFKMIVYKLTPFIDPDKLGFPHNNAVCPVVGWKVRIMLFPI